MRPGPLTPLTAPPAVVLSCLGGAQGDLGVVRALGREGVRVLLVSETGSPGGAEGARGPAALSRYAAEHHPVPGFSSEEVTLEVLERIADAQGVACRPVLIPTADPDLDFVTRHRARLERRFALVSPKADLEATRGALS